MKAKCIPLFVLFLLFGSTAYSAQEKRDRPILVVTSSPNYASMDLVATDSVCQGIPIVGGPNYKYNSYEEAYKKFYENAIKSIIDACKKSGYSGACNLRISYSVNENWYYFYATYDYFKYK